MNDTYTHGHHESVLRSHGWRTAENSAGYLLPRLESGMSVLDVGCGPGTITLDFAGLVDPGKVVGIDSAPDVVEKAGARRDKEGPDNVSFATGDIYRLDFEDDSFDVVHAHQVLQHLTDPVGALRELRRILAPGGVLAVRDSDYPAFAWAPENALLDRWLEIHLAVTRRNGARADAGRLLLGWVQQADFTDIEPTSSTWTFADPSSRSWWGGLWADRVTDSSLADQAIDYGIADADELVAIAVAWRRWSEAADGWFAVLHGEVLASV